MRIGASSSCLYPMLLEDSVQVLLDQGVKTLELFINAESELQEPFLRKICRMTDSAGAEIVSVHPFSSAFEPMLFFTEYLRRFEDGLEFYRRFFRAAELLGARLFVFHGCFTRLRSVDTDEYCARFDRLRRAAEEYGVIFAQENVNGYYSESPGFVRALRENVPEARFVLDLKQCVRAGVSVGEMAGAMDGRIVHIHLSDSAPGEDCLPPGKGVFDFAGLFRSLRAAAPEAETGVIELYRKNYGDVSELAGSLRRLKTILDAPERG